MVNVDNEQKVSRTVIGRSVVDAIDSEDDSELSFSELQVSNAPSAPERTNERIFDRIVNDHKLLLMKTLPAVNIGFSRTTIITPEGCFQLNQEVMAFKCLISAEAFAVAFNDLLFLLDRAKSATDPLGVLAYDKLTLKQLNTLENAILSKQGHTIIGYLFNEKHYIFMVDNVAKLLCRHSSQYPPLPDAYSQRLLRLIKQPIVTDITSSLRMTAQTYILFSYFVSTYFQYNQNSHDDDYLFYTNNDGWLLLAFSSLMMLTMMFLRSGWVDRAFILKEISHIRKIEQSIIGYAAGLTNYGPLITSTSVIEASFLPVLLLGIVMGYISHQPQINVINIAHFTRSQFLMDSFFSSLAVGSFCAFGLYGPISDCLLLYSNYTSSAQVAYLQDIVIARYVAFLIMMIASLPRYPFASSQCQLRGLYASNLMNGISYALLDNYALFIFIDDFFALRQINNAPEKNVVLACFYGLQALSMLAVFVVSFPTTEDLAIYSLEENPIQPAVRGKIHTFFYQMISRCSQSNENPGLKLKSAISIDGLSLTSSQYMSFFGKKTAESLSHPPASTNVTQLVRNPIQESIDRKRLINPIF